MVDFLFHNVSDKEKEKIKKQAKEIMDKFADEISEISEDKEPFIERGEGDRQEGKQVSVELDREIFFENAPNKNEDFIIGERKKW